MKKGKRLLALVIAVSLVAGLAPMSSTSYAEETGEEATLNETVLLTDTFDTNTQWNTTSGYWRLSDTRYAGSRTDVAALGYDQSARNVYYSDSDDGKLTNVHITADVCVTSALNYNDGNQYHFLVARGATAAVQKGVVFGFKTTKGATKSSLIVHSGETTPSAFTPLFETAANYEFNKVYTLELFVVGDVVVAKCDGNLVYAGVVSDMNSTGYCGIMDKRATSTNAEGATKGGYFDNFSLSTITFDGFSVNGPVVVDKTGVGVADITVTSGGVDVAELQDVSVTVADLAGKGCSLYEGNYNVTTTLSGETRTATANRVFVVESIENAVTSMNDERWTGKTAGSNPNFSVDEFGEATLTNSPSVLQMGGDEDASYDDFYVEYILNVSELKTTGAEFVYTRFNTSERATKNATFSADVQYDYRTDTASREFFYSRLIHWTTSSSNSVKGKYSGSTTENDIALGEDIHISFLVYKGTVTFTMNDNIVGTAEYGETTGWFALHKDSASNGVVKVKDFIYVPLTDKMVVDLEVSEIEDVQLYGTIKTPSVIPIYNWTNGSGDATTDGVTIEGFDNTRLGEQTVTVKYSGNNVVVTKEVTVNVVDNSTEIIASETFDSNSFEDTTKWTISNNVVVENGAVSLPNNATATAYTQEYFMDGYVEADIILSNPNIVSGKTVYAPTIICRQAKTGGGEIRTRFAVTYKDNNYTAKVQTLVVDNKNYIQAETNTMYWGTDYTIPNFSWNETYTVRLTCIGNYVETTLNEKVIAQYIIPDAIGVNENNGNFGLQYDYTQNNGYMSVVVDNLDVVKYTSYNINNQNTQITLPTYNKVKVSGTSYESATRNAFHSGETVILTVPEDSQLAVGGLTYTLDRVTDSATYSVFERLYDKDTKPEVCNQFKFEMPSSDITLSTQYYDSSSGEANIGARDTGIREKDGTYKYGLRFSSRAYTTYTSGEATYTLKEVGTLLFNGDVAITQDILSNCYQTKNNGKKLYDENDVLIGKCIPATKAQNICDDFWDWGVILTYQDSYEGTNLYEKEYKAYAYAVYVDSNGKEVVKFASDAKSATHSYNAVAEAIGWSTH